MNKSVYVVGNDYGIRKMWQNHGFKVVENQDKADIVQFIGGADVDPKLYNEERLKVSSFSPYADERDKEAFEEAENKFKVGICRGGQFLNVMSGGRMWQHIDGHGKSHILRDIFFCAPDEEHGLQVTSTHHQMMIPGEKGELLAFGYKIASNHVTADETNIPTEYDTEVVWYPDTNSLCFQPHPEYNGYRDCTKYYFDLIATLMK